MIAFTMAVTGSADSSGLRGADLNLLMVLGALLEERNLTHAGERISMSQPAMSAALARLRRHFDDELLVRVGRGYVLTPLAERTLPLVQQAIAQAEAALEVPPEFDPATSTRQLSISLSDYAMTVLLAPLLELLRRRAPFMGVEIDPLPRDSDEVDSLLQRRDLLIGGLGLGIPGRRQVVFRDRFVCIADQHNPRISGGRLSLEEVAAQRHAVTNFGRGIATPVERALLRRGIQPDRAVTVPGLLPLPFAVVGTPLIAFVPERLARRCASQLGLRIVEVDWEPPELVEGAHWHPGRSEDPTLRWLRGVLKELSAVLDSAAAPGPAPAPSAPRKVPA
jgi:DNA-binding transcriptional LysR family regulator